LIFSSLECLHQTSDDLKSSSVWMKSMYRR
jgi:hypothetical protein